MTVPPALTWTCLFPADASYRCDAAPDWMLQMLRLFEEGGGRVQVGYGQCARSDSKDLIGQIVINPCRGVERELRDGDFTYIRRFAVLPSLRNARWFIPLDSGPIAAGAFSLYTPARASARLKRFVARALAHTRLPLWYRDHLIIASRQMPPIESRIRDLFDGTDIRLAISAGAPEPARNRKPSLAVLNPSGQIIAVAKIGNSHLSRQITAHESSVLSALGSESDLGVRRVPQLLFSGDVDGRFLMVQSALAGNPPAAQLTSAHLRFLDALRRGPVKPALESAMIRSLEARLSVLPNPAPRLLGILDAFRPTLQSVHVPSTIVHGDFAPWNLRQHDSVIAAFDWEYAQLDGLPLIDETHFRLQVGYLLEQWTDERAARELQTANEGAPLGLSAQQACALQTVYLLDMLARLLDEGYDPDDEMVAWYRRVLRRLAPSQKEVVLA